jgi:redox-sensitive bicupin YhaK (pirin superfamily)
MDMHTTAVALARKDRPLDAPNATETTSDAGTRGIALVTGGRRHGPVTRLVSPSDIGELIKPFVFLDHAEVVPSPEPLFGIHPHSGIATLTVVLRGGMFYEDTTGKKGSVPTGGLEWMKAGNGVWHDGSAMPGAPLRAFQLWVALPASEENAPAESQYISPDEVQAEGPARVILGHYGRASSVIRAPAGISYLHVTLKHGERWRYMPPERHTVAWLAVDQGELRAATSIGTGRLAVFEEFGDAIELEAEGDTSFVLGSAIKHPHPLMLGRYSVHTSREALAAGVAEINRIGERCAKPAVSNPSTHLSTGKGSTWTPARK